MKPILCALAMGVLITTAYSGCGSARETLDPDWITVTGGAAFGSQCPYGTYVDPIPAKLSAINCGMPLPKTALGKPLEPLVLQVDCTKKVLGVRTRSGHDTTWEVLPDDTFDFNIEGEYVVIADDGHGHKNCLMPTYINLFGKLECSDRDRATIDFEAVWHSGQLDKTTWQVIPYNKVTPKDDEIFCQVPPSCYLTAGARLRQCS